MAISLFPYIVSLLFAITLASGQKLNPQDILMGPQKCSSRTASCRNTTAVSDLCCFNAPGGQVLLTQFWDSSPGTGPNNSWTVHGLWPDRCDGSFEEFCDNSRRYTNISAIIQSHGKNDSLLTQMSTYWKDYQGRDERFWAHQWNKHGTCFSTLQRTCYNNNNYKPQQEVVDYFEVTTKIHEKLDSFLEKAGIIPTTERNYTSAVIQAALSSFHGFPVTLRCNGTQLKEIWYHYNVRGSIQTGEFIPSAPGGIRSACPRSNIRYLPKYMEGGSATGPSGGPSIFVGVSGQLLIVSVVLGLFVMMIF